MTNDYDFCGYATRNDLLCSDGRIIRRDAFKDCDGKIVPLVWQHQHDDPSNVLGHALLENREDGVYTYGWFNDSYRALNAKEGVKHKDITGLSIYANKLKQNGNEVMHGSIKEVSLVLAGANPGAYIEFSNLSHSDGTECEEATIFGGEEIELSHSDESSKPEEEKNQNGKEEKEMASEKTVQDVYDELTEEQKKVVAFLIGEAVKEAQGSAQHYDFGGDDMKYNVFEGEEDEPVLTHADIETIIADGKRYGSLKESVLQHSQEYGIENIEYLFPDEHLLNNAPEFIKRNDEWVDVVMKGTHHTPFSRVKSVLANITADEARAKGYIKGNEKTEEVFPLLKRTTSPTTIYKKQKLDRDDIVDITDMDVVAWLKTEMRMMLDEEIARAILIGDGRISGTDDKIDENAIRPIWTDAALYTINDVIATTESDTETDVAREFIRHAVKARKNYKGSGNPVLFTTEDVLTECMLIEDLNGRVIYETQDKLASALRVSKIVTVPVMENKTRSVQGVTRHLMGIIVNLRDYVVGADKGGAVNMFDDFDIDYNQQKYLIETRCSGSLIKPYSAIVIEKTVADED